MAYLAIQAIHEQMRYTLKHFADVRIIYYLTSPRSTTLQTCTLGSRLSTARAGSEHGRRPLPRRRISRRRMRGWPARLAARPQRPMSPISTDPSHHFRERHRTAGSGLHSATLLFPALARQRKADGRVAQRTTAGPRAVRPLTLAGGWVFVVAEPPAAAPTHRRPVGTRERMFGARRRSCTGDRLGKRLRSR